MQSVRIGIAFMSCSGVHSIHSLRLPGERLARCPKQHSFNKSFHFLCGAVADRRIASGKICASSSTLKPAHRISFCMPGEIAFANRELPHWEGFAGNAPDLKKQLFKCHCVQPQTFKACDVVSTAFFRADFRKVGSCVNCTPLLSSSFFLSVESLPF